MFKITNCNPCSVVFISGHYEIPEFASSAFSPLLQIAADNRVPPSRPTFQQKAADENETLAPYCLIDGLLPYMGKHNREQTLPSVDVQTSTEDLVHERSFFWSWPFVLLLCFLGTLLGVILFFYFQVCVKIFNTFCICNVFFVALSSFCI